MQDYHIHTTFSFDSVLDIDTTVNKAIDSGLDEIVITDHVDIFWPDTPSPFSLINFEDYFNKIEQAQRKYAGLIKIKKGIELGIQPHSIKETKKAIYGFDFDFIILSVHCVDSTDLCNSQFYQDKSAAEIYQRYFEEVLYIINEFEPFSVLGHIDLVRRYIPNPTDRKLSYSDFSNILDKIFKTLIEKGKGFEVNTSGYRYELDSFMPQIDFVKRFKELGGKYITTGSDAHSPEYVGYKIKEAEQMIKDAGFDYITVFNQLKPSLIKI